MKFLLASLALLLLAAGLVSAQPPVYNNSACGKNTCAEPAEAGPYCVDQKCYQCNPTVQGGDICSCPPTQFCQSDANSKKYGTCIPWEDEDGLFEILGTVCDPDAAASVEKGSNDKLVCAKLNFNTAGLVDFVAWQGKCVRGKCELCEAGDVTCGDARICSPQNRWERNGWQGSFSFPFVADNAGAMAGFWIFLWMWLFCPCVCGILMAVKRFM